MKYHYLVISWRRDYLFDMPVCDLFSDFNKAQVRAHDLQSQEGIEVRLVDLAELQPGV